jgi:hypothetical protein
MCQACNIAAGDGIAFQIVCDNRQQLLPLSSLLSSELLRQEHPSCCDKNIGAELNEFLGQPRKNLRSATRPTRFDFDGFAFNVAGVTQPLAQGIKNRRSGFGKSRM